MIAGRALIYIYLAWVLATAGGIHVWAGGGCLEIRDGYFWDPRSGSHFIPRGIAYQTWNPPVGADQTFEQLEYDLTEFKKVHANSVRCEMVWSQVEPREGAFDFTKPDFLVAKAEQLGLKLFVLIGFQYAPNWFAEHSGWQATNSQDEMTVMLNYEHPGVRHAYSNYISQVTGRYRDSTAIAGWILGNEYAYFDLWNTNHLCVGYDPISLASFQRYLAALYQDDIGALNRVWGKDYDRFEAVSMPRVYPPDRNDPAYHDLTKWREFSIGEYVAVGSRAARLADPNHLRSYSMIGGLFIGNDAVYTCEDARTIVARCAAAGAPLDFWSINNYAWATATKELRSGDFGIAKHRAESGLPVMVSETGHSTTDWLFPDAAPRQGTAVPGQMWTALMSGAIGIHIFTWNDRDLFGGDTFLRERGFGLVTQTRIPKQPVYANVVEMFQRMETLNVDRLFAGSTPPPADVLLFWGEAARMGWPRANEENAYLWSVLRRLGYEPDILNDEPFERGEFGHAQALVLSRCYQMKPEHLDAIATRVVPRGIHVHANADLPGQFDAYHRPNPAWRTHMGELFGLDVSKAVPGLDSGVEFTWHTRLNLAVQQSLGPLTEGRRDDILTWKIWHGLSATSGITLATHTGSQASQGPLPALQLKNLGSARTALNTFALGDLHYQDSLPPMHDWDFRHDWMHAIYRDYFGIQPTLDLQGLGASYVLMQYRFCANGSVLISLLNAHTNSASLRLHAPGLLNGKTVENLTAGGILETQSDGILTLDMPGDQFILLYAYTRTAGVDASLVNPNPNKVWFISAPGAVWPNAFGYSVTAGYDVLEPLDLEIRLERVSPPRKVYARSAPVSIGGKGNTTATLRIPDADLGDLAYRSSAEGGQYLLRAVLSRGSQRVADSAVPVRLLWGVRPQWLPESVFPGQAYEIPVVWQELPSYQSWPASTPLNRAALWQEWMAGMQHYDVVLELRDGIDQVVATDRFLTRDGTGMHRFSLAVPPAAAGPFSWLAYLRPAPDASHDVFDGFEERTPGSIKDERIHNPEAPSPLWPWHSYHYPNPGGAQQWWDEGVGTIASERNWSAFLILTNPVPPLGYSGFGLVFHYPQTWALPNDQRQWSQFTFSCDFLETSGHACVLELQVKDDLDGIVTYKKFYEPGSNGWDTISAPLSLFEVMTNVPASGYFNQARVQSLVVNVQMLDAESMYAAQFDRIRFDGPDRPTPATASVDFTDSFEDRPQGDQNTHLLPWNPYAYAQHNNAAILARGVQPHGSDGFRSGFLLVQNPASPGNYSGFGMYREFPRPWALPAQLQAWTNYVFSFDFKESSGYRCVLELQIKSSADHWLSFFKTYVGSNQWDTVRASLRDFILPPGSQGFDPTQVQTLAVNIQMLDPNVVYYGSFDQIRFEGPETPLPAELSYGTFQSASSFPRDTDGDGLLDLFETGTGIYRGPADAGTDPLRSDTDGDGLADGQELAAGSDPNSADDTLGFSQVVRRPNGDVELTWFAHSQRVYTLYAADELPSGAAGFLPVPNLMNLVTDQDGPLRVVDTQTNGSARRFYRLSVEPVSP
jgi:hypothetical protein